MGYIESLNRLFGRAGVQFVRKGDVDQDASPDTSHMLTSRYVKHNRDELAEIGGSTLRDFEIDVDGSTVTTAIDYLYQIYAERPVRRSSAGGSGFHNLFWLNLVVQSLTPDLIVESGVFKGQSLWMIKSAGPDAEIHAFDVSLDNLLSRFEDVNYHEYDWSRLHLDARNRESLAFFDCHVNQARRVMEAHDRGFGLILFDDSPPANKLYNYGRPGTPTIPMLFDESLTTGSIVKWKWKDRHVSYQVDESEIRDARSLIDSWRVLPDVGSITGYGGFSYMTLVRLV